MMTEGLRSVLAQANALVRSGQEQEAMALFEDLIARRPELGALRVDLALLLLRSGAKDQAAALCRTVLEQDPSLIGARQILGGLQREAGELEAAVATLLSGRWSGLPFADPNAHLALSLFALDRRDELAGLPPAADPGERFVEQVLLAAGAWTDGTPLPPLPGVPAAGARRSVAVFATFRAILDALGAVRKARPELYTGKGAPLYLLGDSHALTPAELRVTRKGARRRIVARLVYGCKAWHLLRAEPNPYRANFEAALEGLPRGAEVFTLFGDLDCRYKGGLLAQSRKAGGDAQAAARALARDYVDYVTSRAADSGLSPGFVTPPASNYDPSLMPLEERAAFRGVLAAFVAALRDAAAAAGLPLVDLFAATRRPDGGARAKFYIDSNHIHPDPFLDAFDK
jgi:tetratricopeptide (TPR) repeat protein